MPKKLHLIDDFSGGWNNSASAKDLRDNESYELVDAYVSEKGKLQLLGGWAYAGSIWLDTHDNYQVKFPNSQCTAFSIDFATSGENQYYLIPCATASMVPYARIRTLGSTISMSGSEVIPLGSTSAPGDSKISITNYIADGSLRICESGDIANREPRWVGVIDRTLFPDGAQYEYVISKAFYQEPTAISPPAAVWCYTTTVSLGDEVIYSVTAADTLAANTGTDYTDPTDAPTANDFSAELSTATLGMDIINSVSFRIEQFSAAGFWITPFAFRAGIKNGTGWVAGTYKYKTESITRYYGFGEMSKWVTIEFPDGGINIGGGGYLKLACQEYEGITGVPIHGTMQWYQVDGRVSVTVGSNWVNELNTVALTVAGSGVQSDYWNGAFNFGVSLVYDDEQESPVTQCKTTDGTNQVSFDSAALVKLCTKYDSDWNQRITGANIYVKKNDNSTWLSYVNCNFITGKAHKEGIYEEIPAGYDLTNTGWEYFIEPSTYEPFVSYESKTLIPQTATTTKAKWGCATIANRIAYIGSVYYDNHFYEDAIFKSLPNKFDTFFKERRLEANINDGDRIVDVKVFNDKLFEFKQNRINVINIADSEGEYLEETLYNNGAEYRDAIVQSDLGLFWVNDRGVWWYDGQRLQELFYEIKDPSRRRINQQWWEQYIAISSTFLWAGGKQKICLGYDNPNRMLFVFVPDVSTGETLIYSVVNDAWFKGDKVLPDGSSSTLKSVFTNADGRMCLYNCNASSTSVSANAGISVWDNEPQSSTGFKYISREINMGSPAEVKNFYGVYITSKEANGKVSVKYDVNGSDDYSLLFYTTSGSTGILLSSSSIATNKLHIPSMDTARSKYSIRLHLDCAGSSSTANTVNSSFIMEDISVIYRDRSPR